MRNLIFLFAIFALSGCAVTHLSKYERLDVERDKFVVYDLSGVMANLTCPDGDKTYSAMLSPLIPLPPIIPIYFMHPNPELRITILKKYVVRSFAIKSGESGRSISVSGSYKNETSDTSRSNTFSYRIGESCSSLAKSVLTINYEDRETKEKHSATYNIEYVDKDFRVDWGYIGA